MKRPAREFVVPKKRNLKLLYGILGGMAATSLAMGLYLLMPNFIHDDEQPGPVYPPVEVLENAVSGVLAGHSLNVDTVQTESSATPLLRVSAHADLPLPVLHMELKEAIAAVGASVVWAKSDPVSGRVNLGLGWHDSTFIPMILYHVEETRPVTGKIALVIDDFGDQWGRTEQAFLSLGIPLTCSVMPGRRRSRETASAISQAGFEVIIHLPMEPVRGRSPNDGYTVMSGMAHEEVRLLMNRALESMPEAVGLNNHMGSKATADRAVMLPLLQAMQALDIYFLDSRTTAKTVAYQIAGELNMPRSKRDVFVDGEMDRSLIRRRLQELADKAAQNGYAVGIAHCRSMTLAVLQDEVQKMLARGFRFVPASDVVERPGG